MNQQQEQQRRGRVEGQMARTILAIKGVAIDLEQKAGEIMKAERGQVIGLAQGFMRQAAQELQALLMDHERLTKELWAPPEIENPNLPTIPADVPIPEVMTRKEGATKRKGNAQKRK